MLKMVKSFLVKNNCFLQGKMFTPKGLMLHSTACKGVPASTFLKSWNVPEPNGRSVCVHGFLDLTGFYQCLPYDMRGWHAGGTANNELIGVEICEPKDYSDTEYFNTIKNMTLEYAVYMCNRFGWTERNVTSHVEANKLKGSAYASSHVDLDHWWLKYHNYSIEDFRKELKEKLEGGNMERFNKIEDIPDWAKPTIEKLINNGSLSGTTEGLDLSLDMIRLLVINDRAGLYN